MAAPQLIWFRQDLRLADQAAVAAAAAAGPVVALYVLDDETPGDRKIGGASRWWLHHSLLALDASLRVHGGALVLRRGRAGVVVPEVAREIGVAAVHALTHYEPSAKLQQAEVAAACNLHLHDGLALLPPELTLSATGTRYRIFTPWWNALLRRMPPGDPQPVPAMSFAALPPGDTLLDWHLLPLRPNWSKGFADWQPGEAGAAVRLADFADRTDCYDIGRNFPSRDDTSRLSPHLHFGEVSPAQVWAAAPHAMPFLREIGWRDFAINLLDQFPDYAWQASRSQFDRFAFRDDPAGLRAWQAGRTGYPIVDAGMRQLWTTGWMHNRVRMIAASFLVKHLLIDWRLGERWFWDTLVDADEASNALGWQWVMGSGVDSSPFNRVFAPVGQSAKFDAAGYIRQWVPELAKLPDAAIHAPWEHGGAKGYPPPIVDHAMARARALAVYAASKA